jgi:putative membrane protein
MMMYWGTGMGGWGIVLMTVGNVLFWGLLIAGIVLLVRYVGRSDTSDTRVSPPRPPQQILAERFARGEIDDEEYRRRRHILDGTEPTGQAG